MGKKRPPGSEAAASAPRNSLLRAICFAVFSLLDPGFAAQRLMELEVSKAGLAAHFGDCERRFHAMVSAHFI
jgi:hypothetical protein